MIYSYMVLSIPIKYRFAPLDGILKNTTTPGQNGAGCNGIEGVLHTVQN